MKIKQNKEQTAIKSLHLICDENIQLIHNRKYKQTKEVYETHNKKAC